MQENNIIKELIDLASTLSEERTKVVNDFLSMLRDFLNQVKSLKLKYIEDIRITHFYNKDVYLHFDKDDVSIVFYDNGPKNLFDSEIINNFIKVEQMILDFNETICSSIKHLNENIEKVKKINKKLEEVKKNYETFSIKINSNQNDDIKPIRKITM